VHVLLDGHERVDLSTDLPLYVDRDGRALPTLDWPAGAIGLLTARAVPASDGALAAGAPGRHVLLGRSP
jgi:hypothetical protein